MKGKIRREMLAVVLSCAGMFLPLESWSNHGGSERERQIAELEKLLNQTIPQKKDHVKGKVWPLRDGFADTDVAAGKLQDKLQVLRDKAQASQVTLADAVASGEDSYYKAIEDDLKDAIDDVQRDGAFTETNFNTYLNWAKSEINNQTYKFLDHMGDVGSVEVNESNSILAQLQGLWDGVKNSVARLFDRLDQLVGGSPPPPPPSDPFF